MIHGVGTRTGILSAVLAVLAALWTNSIRAQDSAKSPEAILAEAFKKLDADGDRLLSEAEYFKPGGDPNYLKRDFRLFDVDRDHQLTSDEFAAIPGPVSVKDRGALPDPFAELLEQAVAALDETYGGWDKSPERMLPSSNFVLNFQQSLAPAGLRNFNSQMVQEADPNGDGRISRDEARTYLETQLGIRSPKRDLLRLGNGRIGNYALFLGLDPDHDDKLTRDEYTKSWFFKTKPPELFDQGDANKDNVLSFAEFAEMPEFGSPDILAHYRWMDTTLDAEIDRDELNARCQEWLRPLIPYTFPQFDLDGNGKLNWNEYQLSMLANPVLSWQGELNDANRDQKLTFDEFTFDQGQFPLLRRIMFHRLDADGDAALSSNEFLFKTKPPNSLYKLNADGSGWTLLYQSKETPSCGSPAVSPDGKLIAFDGYTPQTGINGSRIFVMTIDGQDRRDLCDGLMPSWAPDGKQFCCCRYGESYGVWIMQADGTPVKKIARGWGGQWSPDGKRIAYTVGEELFAYDIEKEESVLILPKSESAYQQIYWNLAWSPDSKQVAFKGVRTNNKEELALLVMEPSDPPKLKVIHKGPERFDNDVAWSPDGKRLVFGIVSGEKKRHLLFELDPSQDAPPKLIPGQDPEVGSVLNSCWTPDGRQIIAGVIPP
jgi:TolB protein